MAVIFNAGVDFAIFKPYVDFRYINTKVDFAMDIIRVPDQLGPKLRAVRVQRGLTQADVARQLGVTVQAVSRLEANAGRASFDRIHRLCLLLGMNLALQPRDRQRAGGVAESQAEW